MAMCKSNGKILQLPNWTDEIIAVRMLWHC